MATIMVDMVTVILMVAITGGKMKNLLLTLLCVIAFTSQAKAFNDDFFNFGDAQYNIYNDNRRVTQKKTVVKNYYNTIVKEVPVPVPVPVAPPPIPPRVILPSCRMVPAQPILDPYGRVLDYMYMRVCY